jgi:hypothetical protein
VAMDLIRVSFVGFNNLGLAVKANGVLSSLGLGLVFYKY